MTLVPCESRFGLGSRLYAIPFLPMTAYFVSSSLEKVSRTIVSDSVVYEFLPRPKSPISSPEKLSLLPRTE